MDIAGEPGIVSGEGRSGLFAKGGDCPGREPPETYARLTKQRYTEALAKLESLRTEFSEEGQVRDLLVQTRQAMERTWMISQALAECDQFRRAEQFDKALWVLDSALAACGAESAILALRSEVEEQRQGFRCAAAGRPMVDEEPASERLEQELEACKKDQEEWQAAQVFFDGRQFQEAERILVRLAAQDRPEVQALLEKVGAARAESEEQQFYKRGRETALNLIQQQLFEQAADLLCNLLTLFPGDPTLEKDLQLAQGYQEDQHDATTLAAPQERCKPEPCEFQPEPQRRRLQVRLVVRLVETKFRTAAPAHSRWAVIATAVLFLLVSPPALDPTHVPVTPGAHNISTQASLGSVNSRPPPRSVLQSASGAVIAAPVPIDVSNFQALRLLSGPSPVIPPLLRLLGIGGSVNLEVRVDSRGRVASVTVLGGHPLLVAAAKDTVLKCQFQPATLNGQPLEDKIRIQVIFEAGRS
jgi:TonB family protein